MTIPRTIHQTAKSFDDPVNGSRMRAWRDKNPGWEYRFYDDEACETFMKQYYPDYVDMYYFLRPGAQRADLFRYLVVLQFGGVYVDSDTECYRPLDEWGIDWAGLRCVFSYECAEDMPVLWKRIKGYYARSQQIMQYFFASEAQSPQLRSVVQTVTQNVTVAMQKKQTPKSWSDNTVLATTGPWAFTEALREYASGRDGVYIAPYHSLDFVTFRHVADGSWRNKMFAIRVESNGYVKVSEPLAFLLVLFYVLTNLLLFMVLANLVAYSAVSPVVLGASAALFLLVMAV